jgi:hypothetical protein
LKKRLDHLNENAPEGTAYKLIYLGRHGQGYRALLDDLINAQKLQMQDISDNLAIDKYGEEVRDLGPSTLEYFFNHPSSHGIGADSLS